MKKLAQRWLTVTLITLAAGCAGYEVRPAVRRLPGSPRTVAIRLIENDSYRERVGLILTDSLARVLKLRADCEIVDEEKDPDQVFVGRVVEFRTDIVSVNAAPDPSEQGLPPTGILTQEYSAVVRISLSLFDRRTGKWVWTGDGFRSVNFPTSAIQLESQGAPLNPQINDSRIRTNMRVVADRWAEDIFNEVISTF